jgi:F-type H+-transporting ATPase subunit b
MTINWWTLALQAVNFLVLVWLLWRFLYRPVRAVIEKRKALSEEAFAKAAAKEAEVDALKKRMEEGRAAMAQERQDLLKKLHEDAAAEREAMLAQSREDANKLIEAARQGIAKERQSALSELQAQAGKLAVDLASKLLSQIDTNALGDAYLEKVAAQLEAMAADELEQLKKDLEPAEARLLVVTAVPIAEAARARWRKRLGTQIGREDRTDFETDPAIVGGAELRFPHTTLKFTWADQLRKAERVLNGDNAAS